MANPKYKVEYLNADTYTSKMGMVNFEEMAKQSEALLNEYDRIGYHLFKIIENKDSMNRSRLLFYFVSYDQPAGVDRITSLE